MFNLILVAILIVISVSLFRDGLWSNAIALINIVTAGLIATNYFEPATQYLSELVPYMDYNWDVLALGTIFGAVYMLLWQAGLIVSQYQVRFHPVLDQVGAALLAIWIGWVAVCFVTFAIHTSPLARNFLKESFQPEQRLLYGLAPDRKWIGFVAKLSDGGGWGANEVDANGNITTAFDPKGEMLIKYASRRTWLEKHESAFAGEDDGQ